MIIKKATIENYRSIQNVTINFDSMVSFLGRNGSGKSSVLYALDLFFDVSKQITEYDYFAKDTTRQIKIQITFGNLTDDEKAEFGKYLQGDEFAVTKLITIGGARYFGVLNQIPEFAEIRNRNLAAGEFREVVNALIDAGTFDGFGPKQRGKDAAIALMAQYEAAHQELTQPIISETQFLGPRNIGGGLLDKYTRFVLIPAVRDAIGETDRKGAILQLIDLLVTRSINSRADVRELNEEIERRLKEVYSTENLTELRQVAQLINSVLVRYAPDAELDLEFGSIQPPKVSTPPALATLVEDNFKAPISHVGHGLQRALIIALLQQLSLTESRTAGGEDAPDREDGVQQNLILAIEEPELYLHPSRSRFLSSVLATLSAEPENPQDPRMQIIYATHSPYFIDIEHFDKIRVARKRRCEGINIGECVVSEFARREAIERLALLHQRNAADMTNESFKAHAVPTMTSIVNEGFFGNAVVVVEGPSDVGALWAIQDILGKRWDEKSVVVVPAGGKYNMDKPIIIFRGLAIPTYFVFDGDSDKQGVERDKAAGANRRFLNLVGAREMDFPDTQAHQTWAVFSQNIEEELKGPDPEYFDRTRAVVATELGYKPSSVLKNSDGMARYIRQSYSDGIRFPVLEEIANHVTAL